MAASTASLIAAVIETSEQPDPSGSAAPRLEGGTDGDGRTARRIVAVIGRMISAGTLDDRHAAAHRAGTVAPPRRPPDHRLGGVAQPRQRRGDRDPGPKRHLRPPAHRPGGPRRYRQITEGPGHFALDLSSGTPDPLLLPDLAPIVARVGRQSLTSSYLDQPVLPEPRRRDRGDVAVPAGRTHGRRRRARRLRSRRIGRVAPRRPGRRRAPDVPADRRPARSARLRGGQRRRRRRGPRARPAGRPWRTDASPAATAPRRCSSNHAPTIRPASRCRRAGRRRSRPSWPGRTRSSSRTTTPTTSRRRRW